MPMPKKGVHADKVNYNSISKVEADGVISELDELIKSRRAEVVFEVWWVSRFDDVEISYLPEA